MASLFQKLQFQAFRGGIPPRTEESREWFRNKLKNMRTVNRQSLIRDDVLTRTTRPRMGEMLMFFYDPKNKETLPYYDTFPLVIMVEKAPGGFYGLNLHYLPHSLRAKFLDQLYDTTNNEKYDSTTRFRLTYDILQKVSQNNAFLPCVKHYLSDHIRSKLAVVDSADWEIAIFLPTEQFKKSGLSNIYRDSRRIMRQAQRN